VVATVTTKAVFAKRAQVDHNDGQECAPGGQLGCGDYGSCTQTRGAQAQPVLHRFQSQGG